MDMNFNLSRIIVLLTLCFAQNFAESTPSTLMLEATPFRPADEVLSLVERQENERLQTNCTDHDFRRVTGKVKHGSTTYQALSEAGVEHDDINRVIRAAAPFQNLSQVPSNTKFVVQWNRGSQSPKSVEFNFKQAGTLVLSRLDDEIWIGKVQKVRTYRKLFTFSGVLEGSFWDSARATGMPAHMVLELTNLFASMVDFNREAQQNDRWRLVVERFYSTEAPVRWGKILVAEYESAGMVYTGVLFDRSGLRRKYYAPDGSSLTRLFLKSPIEFGRVTSGFSRNRFHPILKVRMPHYGVDYGAVRGTPVMAVGDGVVTVAHYRGAGGNTVMVRHSSKYKTAYKHLSRFAKGVRPGKKVEMGQIIGYVGATGRATGPHLHFEFYEGGRYVDPLGMKFPSLDPLPAKHMEAFREQSARYLSLLPEWKDPRIMASIN